MSVSKKDKTATKITYHGYSYGFKVNVVEEIENGLISMNQAAIKYGVSRTTVQKWAKKFGNLEKKLKGMGGRSPKQEIAELKKKLRIAEAERDILETAIEIIEDEYGVDVKKKFLPESLKHSLRKLKRG